MLCYLDSSALLKRVVSEAESNNLNDWMAIYQRGGASLLTSVLSEVEIARALWQAVAAGRLASKAQRTMLEAALGAVSTVALTKTIRAEAQTIGGDTLRSLDAIHVATAWLAGADVVVTYDDRMIQACMAVGLPTARPGVTGAVLPPGWAWISDEEDVFTPARAMADRRPGDPPVIIG